MKIILEITKQKQIINIFMIKYSIIKCFFNFMSYLIFLFEIFLKVLDLFGE